MPETTIMQGRFVGYLEALQNFSEEVTDHKQVHPQSFRKLEEIHERLFQEIHTLESLFPEEIREIRAQFREETDALFNKSCLMQRARRWFRGYPGDFETLEYIYKGVPPSEEGIGIYLDVYFLTRELAIGVRNRKDHLKAMLTRELKHRVPQQSILNIACGSCRELYEMIEVLNEKEPIIFCTDTDEDALNYSANLLFAKNMKKLPQFINYNALKLVSKENNEKIFGKQDIIYSAGLFDYLKDEGVAKITEALFDLLNPGGIMILPFKDCRYYNAFDYKWLGDWSAFLQRTPSHVLSIFEKAGIRDPEIIPSDVPAIKFFIIRKP